MRVPQYRRRRDRNRASVRIRGRDHYLPGPIDSPESWGAYHALIARCVVNDCPDAQPRTGRKPAPLTVAEAAERWLQTRVAESIDRRDLANLKPAAKALVLEHGMLWISDFGPKALKHVQARLVKEGRNRQGANRVLRHIREFFKWAASEQLIAGGQLTELRTVDALRYGKAPERPRRRPATPAAVQTILEHFEAVGNLGAAGVVRVMRATAMRPGEVCRMTWGDLEPCPDGLIYRPAKHKNSHRGLDRVVGIVGEALAAVRASRGMRVPEPTERVFVNVNGESWTPNALLLAFRRAVKATGCAPTAPYEVRHMTATALLNATGDRDLTRALLGHAHASMTDHYTPERQQLALRAAQHAARLQGGAA